METPDGNLSVFVSRDAVDARTQFLQRGGPIDAASCYERTNLSVSGARFKSEAAVDKQGERIPLPLPSVDSYAVVAQQSELGAKAAALLNCDASEVNVEMTSRDLEASQRGAPVLLLRGDDRLLMVETAIGTTIDGTLATCEAGEGSALLRDVALRTEGSLMVQMRYGDRPDPTSTMGLASLAYTHTDGRRGAIAFAARRDAEAEKADREALVDAVAEYTVKAWERRNPESAEAMVYRPQPMLHKTVMLADHGVGGSPYKMLSSYVEDQRAEPLSMVAIEGLFAAAFGAVLGERDFGPNTRKLLSGTAVPGIEAASHVCEVGTAVSIIEGWLESYRADGVSRLKATPATEPVGQVFVPVEHWPNTADVDFPIGAGDCDNSAASAIGILKRVRDDRVLRDWMRENDRRRVESTVGADGVPVYDKGDFWFSRAVYNAVFPWHIPALGLVGAYGAEAASAGDGAGHESHERAIVGHAIGMLVPASQAHAALYAGSVARKVLSADQALEELEARERQFEAGLPTELATAWRMTSRDERAALPCIPLEGTSPATARFYDPDSGFAHRAKAEGAAMRKLPPTTARGWQHLHVNGRDGGHQFYHAVVEATFESQPTVPRQMVLGEAPAEGHVGPLEAGASPSSLHFGTYIATGLVDETPSMKAALDAGSAECRRHRVGVRTQSARVLSPMRLADLNASLDALAELDRKWSVEEDVASGTVVTFAIPFNQLVFNANCVKTTAAALAASASGVVDIIPVSGLLHDEQGRDVGKCVVISAVPK